MTPLGFTLFAGIEISQGQVALIHHGDVDARRTFGDPAEAAGRWIEQGATWIHLADLDAQAGTGANHEALAAVLARCRGEAAVQLAAGIRDQASLDAAMALRPQRIVLDTGALADPDWTARAVTAHSGGMAAELDVHDGLLFAPGTPAHGSDLSAAVDLLRQAGCPSYVVADVDAKGVRKSGERHALQALCAQVDAPVIAAGGIGRLEDLHALVDLVPAGIRGAIVDEALYTDAFWFSEALAAVAPRYDPWMWGPARP